MEVTMNHANMNLGDTNADFGNPGWQMPDFGIQKYVALTVKSISHTIHGSFDYHSKATTRELVIFIIFAIVLQGALIPTESYSTLHADASMLTAAALVDLETCIVPGIALLWRWVSHLRF